MANRKKHLKYRASKTSETPRNPGKLAPSNSMESSQDEVAHKKMATKKGASAAVKQKKAVPQKYSALTPHEAGVVRKELLHLMIAAAGLAVLYAVLWGVLTRTGLESYLTELIKLQ